MGGSLIFPSALLLEELEGVLLLWWGVLLSWSLYMERSVEALCCGMETLLVGDSGLLFVEMLGEARGNGDGGLVNLGREAAVGVVMPFLGFSEDGEVEDEDGDVG